MKAIYLGILLVAFTACKNNEPEVKVPPVQEASTKVKTDDLNKTASTETVVFENESFGAVYTAYLDLKAALVNTNAEAATTAANALLVQATQEDLESLKSVAQEVVAAENIKQQREAFERVTAVMETTLETQPITSGTIYKQYCPMAFDGKGAYWLSNAKEIRNPYFGDQMLTCGAVDSEIQ